MASTYQKHIRQEVVYATDFFGKFCTKCDELKSSDKFPGCPKSVSGLGSQCKACLAKEGSRRLKDPLTRGKMLKTMNSCRLARAYGITIDQRDDLINLQNGKCAICKIFGKRLVVDHNHATGKVREMLCFNCNSGIGMFGDCIENIQSALDYINKHKSAT